MIKVILNPEPKKYFDWSESDLPVIAKSIKSKGDGEGAILLVNSVSSSTFPPTVLRGVLLRKGLDDNEFAVGEESDGWMGDCFVPMTGQLILKNE